MLKKQHIAALRGVAEGWCCAGLLAAGFLAVESRTFAQHGTRHSSKGNSAATMATAAPTMVAPPGAAPAVPYVGPGGAAEAAAKSGMPGYAGQPASGYVYGPPGFSGVPADTGTPYKGSWGQAAPGGVPGRGRNGYSDIYYTPNQPGTTSKGRSGEVYRSPYNYPGARRMGPGYMIDPDAQPAPEPAVIYMFPGATPVSRGGFGADGVGVVPVDPRSADAATIPQVYKRFYDNSRAAREAMSRGDVDGASKRLRTIRQDAGSLPNQLNNLDIERRLNGKMISRKYSDGARMADEGMRTGDGDKVQMGMEKIDEANHLLNEMRGQ